MAKESKHAAIKYDLSNRSRSVDTNGKWFQVMRSNYVRAFYLAEHHPLPSMLCLSLHIQSSTKLRAERAVGKSQW